MRLLHNVRVFKGWFGFNINFFTGIADLFVGNSRDR